MKKTIYLSSILFILVTTTQAQVLKVGPRIGINTSRIALDSGVSKLYDPQTGFGYQVGIVGRISLPLMYIQPELLFTEARPQYAYQQQIHKLCYRKLNLPIMLGISILELVRIQLGPVFSLLLQAKRDELDVASHYKNITVGYQVGIGLDVQRLMIDLKYEGSLSRFGNQLGSVTIDHRDSLLMLSVGINLL